MKKYRKFKQVDNDLNVVKASVVARSPWDAAQKCKPPKGSTMIRLMEIGGKRNKEGFKQRVYVYKADRQAQCTKVIAASKRTKYANASK